MTVSYQQLERLIEVGRHREATQLLDQAFAEIPHDPDLHCLAARAALGQEDRALAAEHVEAALHADPQHSQARLLLFFLHRLAKRYADAERVISELIREAPGDATRVALYGELMLTTLHLDKARALTDEALRRDPEHGRARVLDVLLLTAAGKRGEAETQLAELVRDDPESSEVAFTLFQVLVERRRYREALEVGRQLLRLAPDNRPLVEALADLRVQTHWVAWPAYPFRRWGWVGTVVVWLVGVGTTRLVSRMDPRWGVVVGLAYVLYVIYSWVYPPLLKRWLLKRGF